jgi:hypothetical protein
MKMAGETITECNNNINNHDAKSNQRAELEKEKEHEAALAAKVRARSARWDLDLALFLFTILITVIILLFQNIAIEVVGPVAALGLALVWLLGWMRGKRLYLRFYEEEKAKLARQTMPLSEGRLVEEPANLEELVEQIVLKEIRNRRQRD